MKNRIIVFALILLFLNLSTADATVCKLEGLEGFDLAKSRGDSFVGENTSNLDQVSLYVEMTKEGPWFQSNYVEPGYRYPTKIGNEPINDAQLAFLNIVMTEETYISRPDIVGETINTYEKNTTIFVDQSVFNKDGTTKINFNNATKLIAVDGASGKELGRVEKVVRNREEEPVFFVKALGCCFFGIPPHAIEAIINRLQSLKFDKSKLELFSLVNDSATVNALKNSKVLKNHIEHPEGLDSISILKDKLALSKGKTLVVVGHVENKKFVNRDASGKKIFEQDILELHSLAKENDVELVLLGCETSKNIDIATLGGGVIGRFNTLDAVSNLERAVSKSKNFADFFENITSSGLMFVGGEKLLSNSETVTEVSIFSKAKQAINKKVLVGIAYLLGRNSNLKLPSSFERNPGFPQLTPKLNLDQIRLERDDSTNEMDLKSKQLK